MSIFIGFPVPGEDINKNVNIYTCIFANTCHFETECHHFWKITLNTSQEVLYIKNVIVFE